MKILSDSSTMEGPHSNYFEKRCWNRERANKKGSCFLYGNQSGTKYLEDKEVEETT